MKERVISLVKFFLGWPLSLFALFFIGKIVFSQTHAISFNTLHINWVVLLLSIGAFLLYFLLRSFFWHTLLKTQGHDISLQQTTFLWGISELQRYIPGNIWGILGRTISFNKLGVEKMTIAKSWLYESEFLFVATTLLCVLGMDFIIFGVLPFFPFKHILTTVLIVLQISGAVFFLNNKRFVTKENSLTNILPRFSLSSQTTLLLQMILAFFCYGVGTYFAINTIFLLYPHDFMTFIGFFSFAYFVGYMSFIFPMGLGPREGVMIAGLSKYIPLQFAAGGTVIARLLLIASEILFLFFTYLWYRVPTHTYQSLSRFVTKHKYLLLTLLFVSIYITYFSTASFFRYDNFFTGRFDLGNMDQTVWNTVHGRIFQLTDPDGTNIISRLAIHADYILVLIAPFYLLWQDPRMLLLIQSIVLGCGAIFVFLLGKRILKNEALAFIFSLSFLLNPSVEYSNLYDFHAVVLGTTFLLGAFYFMKAKKTVWFLLFLVLAGITKEEVWVVVALMGIYAFFIEKLKLLGGAITVTASVIFYAIFFKAIPLARHGQHFALTFYSDFGSSPFEVVKTIFLSPLKTFTTIFTISKLNYLLQLLLPLGFFSLFAPLFLIFALPDLAINLLSSNSSFHKIYFQYTAIITPFLFIAAMYGLSNLQRRFPKIAMNVWISIVVISVGIAVHAYGPSPLSKSPNTDMFWRTQPDKEIINEYLDAIPKRYSIAATNNIGSHISHRQRIYTIPTGVDSADILVFLLNDEYAQPSLPEQIAMTEKLRMNKRYVEVIHAGNFVVFEKQSIYPHPKSKNKPNSFFPIIIHQLKSISGKNA